MSQYDECFGNSKSSYPAEFWEGATASSSIGNKEILENPFAEFTITHAPPCDCIEYNSDDGRQEPDEVKFKKEKHFRRTKTHFLTFLKVQKQMFFCTKKNV